MENLNWIASRERNNFYYTRGQEVIFEKDCKNCLVISDLRSGIIKGETNLALIKTSTYEEKIPISEIEKIVYISSKILNGKEIFHSKPKSIFERENLPNLTKEEIKENIFQNYNLDLDFIQEIENKKGKNRIYLISSNEKERFILKYRGRDKDLFNFQVSLLKDIPYFPKILDTVDSNPYTSFYNGIYAIEEFVKGDKFPKDNERYFELLGKYLGWIHHAFGADSKKYLENFLIEEGNPLSESNLISLQVDLSMNNSNNFLLNEAKSLSNRLNRIDLSPNQIIHGDLNKSNLIWEQNNARIIDSENIRFSKRARDFVAPLLLEGDFKIPDYFPNSARKLIGEYNFFSDNPINSDEEHLIFDLLKINLIKFYTIYNIRRNQELNGFKKQIVNCIRILNGEDYDY